MNKKGIIATIDALSAFSTIFIIAGTIVVLLSSSSYEGSNRSLVLNQWADDFAEIVATDFAYGCNNTLKLTGTCSGGAGSVLRVKFSDVDYEIQDGDFLEYDLYIDSSPENKSAVVLNSSTIGGPIMGLTDQNGESADADNDLVNWADNKWYRRLVNLSTATGQTINDWLIVNEGETNGLYTVYVDNVRIVNNNAIVLDVYRSGAQEMASFSGSGYMGIGFTSTNTFDEGIDYLLFNDMGAVASSGGFAVKVMADSDVYLDSGGIDSRNNTAVSTRLFACDDSLDEMKWVKVEVGI